MSYQEEYKRLDKKIISAYRKLKKKDPNNILLNLAIINRNNIQYTKKFKQKYYTELITIFDEYDRYLNDIEKLT